MMVITVPEHSFGHEPRTVQTIYKFRPKVGSKTFCTSHRIRPHLNKKTLTETPTPSNSLKPLYVHHFIISGLLQQRDLVNTPVFTTEGRYVTVVFSWTCNLFNMKGITVIGQGIGRSRIYYYYYYYYFQFLVNVPQYLTPLLFRSLEIIRQIKV